MVPASLWTSVRRRGLSWQVRTATPCTGRRVTVPTCTPPAEMVPSGATVCSMSDLNHLHQFLSLTRVNYRDSNFGERGVQWCSGWVLSVAADVDKKNMQDSAVGTSLLLPKVQFMKTLSKRTKCHMPDSIDTRNRDFSTDTNFECIPVYNRIYIAVRLDKLMVAEVKKTFCSVWMLQFLLTGSRHK